MAKNRFSPVYATGITEDYLWLYLAANFSIKEIVKIAKKFKTDNPFKIYEHLPRKISGLQLNGNST